MLRAGIYIRKSKLDNGREAHRLELQRKKLPAYAASQNWSCEIYDDGIISLDQLKIRNQEHKNRIEELRKAIMGIDLELAREGLDLDIETLSQRFARFREDLTRIEPCELRALVDPLISKARLFNEKVELNFSFPVDGEYTHVYALPGKKEHADSRPRSSMDQSTRLLSAKYRFDSCRGHFLSPA